MLSQAPVTATIAVNDLERAKAFYRDQLGLPIQMDLSPDVIFLGAGGETQLQVYGTQGHKAGTATVATFAVGDLRSVVAGLEKRGVHFEAYDRPGLRTGPDHIADLGTAKLAWITDPEGNIIALAQM